MEKPSAPNPERITSRVEFEAEAQKLATKYKKDLLTIIEMFAHDMNIDVTTTDGVQEKLDELYNNHLFTDVRWRLIEAQLDHEQEQQARAAAEKNALTDALTGLYNRGALDNHLSRLAETYNRSKEDDKKPFSLILIDLDNFKQINDNFGHPAGDAVLEAVAEIVEAHTRATDLAARYGGEEIAIVIDGPLTNAKNIAERIRLAIAALDVEKFKIDQSLRPNITASFGVAEYQPDAEGTGLPELLEKTDTALYEAKRTGKNRVCVA
jgi:diguanylate cyclase (GGDEF)-like protein